ncbi:MAG: hypothetical protein H6Q99_2827 [Proteobacteria bacterium]|nr:hypothetical protein [Pseudomonadota bacterium]
MTDGRNISLGREVGELIPLVAEHRLGLDDAHEVAHDLACRLVKKAYRL